MIKVYRPSVKELLGYWKLQVGLSGGHSKPLLLLLKERGSDE
jgi:hypothetical protein